MMAYTNNKPHVNFEINKELDYWTVGEFLTFDSNDTFSNTILMTYPKLKNSKNLEGGKKFTYCKNYVDQVYKDKEIELINTKMEVQKSWNLVEQRFLDKTQNLFNGHLWPEGAYVGFLSIFNCNPRFLDEKTFQVYYSHPEGLVYVCAHEMLHFIFYDYLDRKLALTREVPESTIWDLSEIFNVITLETPEFVEITGNHKLKPYKEHENLMADFRRLNESSENIDEFIKQSFKLLV